MKKCSVKINQKCNKKALKECPVVTDGLLRPWSKSYVSIVTYNLLVNEKTEKEKTVIFDISTSFSHARHDNFSTQNLDKKLNLQLQKVRNSLTLRQHFPEQNINKTNEKIEDINYFKYQFNHLNYINIKSFNFNNTCDILLSGDIEENPGPVTDRNSGQEHGVSKRIHVTGKTKREENEVTAEVITYNCRGLKEHKKLKRMLNSCHNVINRNKLSIIFLQETHLEKKETEKLRLMWRGNFCISPGEGASRG